MKKTYDKWRRPRSVVAVAAMLALTLAACGDDSDEGTSQGAGTTPKAAEQEAAPAASILSLTGTSTSVDLDAGTAKVLADNKVTVEPVAPATASTSGGTTTVSFPITEGYVAIYPPTEPSYIRGTFSHVGGLKFTSGGKSLELTNFIVNPGDSTLTATVEGGSAASILDLDGTNVKVTEGAQGQTRLDGTIAKLSQTGADALNKFFNVSIFKAGIPLGEVHVVAGGTAGPKGSPQAEILSLTGTSTSVDLDAGTAKVLADNKVTVEPLTPATASTSGGTTTVSFPITEGYVAIYPPTEPSYIRGTFSHVGGLRFTAAGRSLELTDFIVNPGNSTLTATVEGGSAASILDLDGTNVKVTEGAQGQTRLDGTIAKLSQTGADALNKFFNVSIFKAGIPLGEVHVVAGGTAVPGC